MDANVVRFLVIWSLLRRSKLGFAITWYFRSDVNSSTSRRSAYNWNAQWIQSVQQTLYNGQREVYCVRIRTINNKLHQLEATYNNLQESLGKKLPAKINAQITTHVESARESEFLKARQRQVDKFNRLHTKLGLQSAKSTHEIDLSGEQLKKWVVNLSKYTLNQTETKVLAKGLNFAITPKSIPVEEFVVATEKACIGLQPQQAEGMRSEVVNVLKRPRLRCPMCRGKKEKRWTI